MKMYDIFPDQEPYDLYTEELDIFIKNNIWPAADHFWDERYKESETFDDIESKIQEIQSPNGERKLELSISLESEATIGDDGEVDESVSHDIYVSVGIKAFRQDITRSYRKKFLDNNEVWEVCTYDFYLEGPEHEADRYYVFKDDSGEDMDHNEISHKQRRFLQQVCAIPKYNPERDAKINSQDIIDVHNILLALEVPDGVISLTRESW
jgi:hypothetical protein